MEQVGADWTPVWEPVTDERGNVADTPILRRAPLPNGWLVASKVAGGWSITFVPSAGGGAPTGQFGQFDEILQDEPPERVTRAQLDGLLGKHIRDICGNKLAADSSNHCAHFANHVMQLDFGWTCKKSTGGKAPSANLRVHETFARCGAVGLWPPPPTLTRCYAFVTRKSGVNLKKKEMTNIPKKHIGIFHTDFIWHYSNSKRKVVKQLPADFAKHYKGEGFAVFYGEFPPP